LRCEKANQSCPEIAKLKCLVEIRNQEIINRSLQVFFQKNENTQPHQGIADFPLFLSVPAAARGRIEPLAAGAGSGLGQWGNIIEKKK
jgi:hypothetical protein